MLYIIRKCTTAAILLYRNYFIKINYFKMVYSKEECIFLLKKYYKFENIKDYKLFYKNYKTIIYIMKSCVLPLDLKRLLITQHFKLNDNRIN